MPLDGAFLFKLKNELSALEGAYLDKINQPSRDELVFLLRSKNGASRLLVSAKQGAARVHITAERPENPASPPMFCMLLRKYLSSARLVEIKQVGFERVLYLVFSSKNEMGDIIYPKIICELIGSQPNVIFTDTDNVIIDALHRSDIEKNTRLIQPGARYVPPAQAQKINLLSVSNEEIIDKLSINGELPLWKALLDNIEGMSPLVAREISLKVCNSCKKCFCELSSSEKMNIAGVLNSLKKDISENDGAYVLFDQKDIPKDFSFTQINQYLPEYKSVFYPTLCQALDAFYLKKENTRRIQQSAQDLFKILYVLINRTERKTAIRKKDLLKCADREKYRIYGELIKANLYRLTTGLTCFEAENYYDENLSKITIPLDPALSPANNADKYFKEYKKSYTAEKMLTQLIKQDEEELKYLDSVLDSLSRAQSISELNEIREELSDAGIIRIIRTSSKKTKPDSNFREYSTPSGKKILVGKNNRQNDLLTLNTASKNDIWFHTKNIPGSHTVLVTDGQPTSEEDLIYTAQIAAYHSKAQSSSGVPVDYTLIKFVKKPNGAKSGMVIYSNEKTLFVTPNVPN